MTASARFMTVVLLLVCTEQRLYRLWFSIRRIDGPAIPCNFCPKEHCFTAYARGARVPYHHRDNSASITSLILLPANFDREYAATKATLRIPLVTTIED